MIEVRDNGDLVIFATNGDPLVKLGAEGRFLMVNTNHYVGDDEWFRHPLNARAEQLDREAVAALRRWCEENEREAA